MKYQQIVEYLLENPTQALKLQSDADPTRARAALYNGVRRAYAATQLELDTDLLLNPTSDLTVTAQTEITFNITATPNDTGTELIIKLARVPTRLTFQVLGVEDALPE